MFEIGIIIAVVMAVTQLIKELKVIPKKYLPLISLLLGLAAGIFFMNGVLKEQIMYGLMIGLSASGLFDQSKIVTKNKYIPKERFTCLIKL
ncbi:holin [Oceanobacillus sp. Castelsardo]|uniref:holin n=1 Tax=Oceanobacillus sp. Castelsardo TaxID=1851204 RepID=UPI00083952FD|nr:holin [Oceanobacillus sp. Castelsardo]